VSGEHHEAHAEVAEGTGTAHGPEVNLGWQGATGGVAGPRSILTANARAAKLAAQATVKAEHVRRAKAYRADDHSLKEIGHLLAVDENRRDDEGEWRDYDVRQVGKWLRGK
jgi:hypothetical protein